MSTDNLSRPPIATIGRGRLIGRASTNANARTHSPEQIEQLRGSFRTYGQVWPILVREDGTVISGHGRIEAAKAEGFETLQVIVARGWTSEQCRAFALLDNRVPLNAGWDDEMLRIELSDLNRLGVDVGALGFETSELDLLLGPIGGATDPDEAPEAPAVPISKPGDVWLLGRHRLLCGDATNAEDVARLLGGATPDLANCDPPYGVSIVKTTFDGHLKKPEFRGGSVGGAKAFGSIGGIPNSADPKHISNFSSRGRGRGLGKAGFDRVHGNAAKAIIPTGIYPEIIGDTAIAAFEMLASLNVPAIVMWGGNYYADALPCSRCWFVWDKEVTGTFAEIEMAWTNCDQVSRLFRHQWNGLMKASERGEKRVHPTQKPVALAEWVIGTAAPEAETTLDLFLGSGSTLIAAERKNLQHFGMELAPMYVDLSILRWQNVTGLVAKHEASGQSFVSIKEDRAAAADKDRAATLLG